MNPKQVDFLIVGQGIAGTLISYQLSLRNQSYKLIDSGYHRNTSLTASGIINPITGRKFVKSWMIDQLLGEALECYNQLETKLDISIIKETSIIRGLQTIKEENDWEARKNSKEYRPYLAGLGSNIKLPDSITIKGTLIENKAFLIGNTEFINTYRKLLIEEGKLLNETLLFEDLKVNSTYIQYKDIKSKAIIFCEGWRVIKNPYFKYLNFEPVKGEVLLVKIPNLKSQKIFKQKIFLVPIHDDIYWVGSTYDWSDLNDEITNIKKEYLIAELENMLSCPFRIIKHKAGVRPSTKLRKPLMGVHPHHHNVYLFNGLGTKGFSLGPYWSKHFVANLSGENKLNPIVDISKLKPE